MDYFAFILIIIYHLTSEMTVFPSILTIHYQLEQKTIKIDQMHLFKSFINFHY